MKKKRKNSISKTRIRYGRVSVIVVSVLLRSSWRSSLHSSNASHRLTHALSWSLLFWEMKSRCWNSFFFLSFKSSLWGLNLCNLCSVSTSQTWWSIELNWLISLSKIVWQMNTPENKYDSSLAVLIRAEESKTHHTYTHNTHTHVIGDKIRDKTWTLFVKTPAKLSNIIDGPETHHVS